MRVLTEAQYRRLLEFEERFMSNQYKGRCGSCTVPHSVNDWPDCEHERVIDMLRKLRRTVAPEQAVALRTANALKKARGLRRVARELVEAIEGGI